MNKRRITFLRRTVQILSLVMLVYGGYIFKVKHHTTQQANLFPALKAPEGYISTTKFDRGSILWPSGDNPVLENYPPGLVCRFNPRGGLFKACIVHFISENLTWRTSFKYLLPHLTLFMLLCFLFGRLWCGWACPIGTVGDFLTMLRKKMNIPSRKFPAGFRNGLRSGSYGILGTSFFISALIGVPHLARFQCYWFLPYCQICPARLICPIFGLIKPGWKDFETAITTMFTILAWLVLGIFVAAFYWGRRIWCHLCPVGLMNSWFNRGAGVELKKISVKCNKCGLCTEACPMGLTEMFEKKTDGVFNQSGCIMCLRCVEICPRDGCLSANFFGRKIVESRLKK